MQSLSQEKMKGFPHVEGSETKKKVRKIKREINRNKETKSEQTVTWKHVAEIC